MSVVVRFAPSPTGFLHIGGARTALFNWLFARHNGGKFLLRIEDTDKERSTKEAIDAIIAGMEWLELEHDDEIVMQSARAARHAEVAHQLLKEGKAYLCYSTPEELEAMRAQAMAEKRSFRYDGRWRDRSPSEAPKGAKAVVRLKAPLEGSTVIDDAVQGTVTVENKQLDDLVLLRSDGTPTYMLAVVVDDHDMGVTHIIRGDDHLTNASRQALIYQALGWNIPQFAHIPLIHGPDGAKLSKRHGALGVDAYRDMGYLPEAMRNYLLRLGWSHGNEEIINTLQAVEWFDLESVGKSPARFDFAKLNNLNGHYIREAGDKRLVELVQPFMEERIKRRLTDLEIVRLTKGMNGLKQRAKTLIELADSALFYTWKAPFAINEKAQQLLDSTEAHALLSGLVMLFEKQDYWDHQTLEEKIGDFAAVRNVKLGTIAQLLRAALTGSTVSPSVFDIMTSLGKEETLTRIRAVLPTA